MPLNLRKIYTTNGAYIQISLYGNLFGFWGIGANDQMLYLIMSLYHENESENAYTKFI